MRRAFAAVGLCLLAGCAKPPYDGLNKQSYGRLTNYMDSQTKISVTPQLCDPSKKYEDVNQLSKIIVGGLFTPVGGMTKIDDKILKEDLQDNFRTPGDFNMPNVVLLESNQERIVFWYEADLVNLSEVAKAAAAHCGKRHKRSLYEGSARRCSPPHQMPVSINGQSTEIDTYVISSFQCGT